MRKKSLGTQVLTSVRAYLEEIDLKGSDSLSDPLKRLAAETIGAKIALCTLL